MAYLRSLVVLLAIFGVLYFSAGVLLGTAADQPWSSIHYGKPIVWSRLPADAARVWDTEPRVRFGLTPLAALMLGAALTIQFLLAKHVVNLRVLSPLVALLVIGLLPALFGAVELFWTIVNALFLRGLDGEWIDEGAPIFEGFFIVFSSIATSLVTQLVRLQNLRLSN